jgi:bifunctional polynucleotide phosphatase/kinase
LFKKPGSEPATAVRWLPKLGAGCVHGVHLTPPSYPKVAMFDVDGSIIVVKSGAKWPKDENDWTWWRPLVPKKLKEIHEAK